MKPQEIYEIWSPAESVWSKWAKPVLFVGIDAYGKRKENENPSGAAEVVLEPDPNLGWMNSYRMDTAVIVNLPGGESVEMGMQLASYGFRPVPLYNCTNGPQAVVDVAPIMLALAANTAMIHSMSLPPEAPPAFLIDSMRNNTRETPKYGQFDNRWMIFPQDFPSGTFLKSQGIRRVLVIQNVTKNIISATFAGDLYEVLQRWHNDGLEILMKDVDSVEPPAPTRFSPLARIRFTTIALALTLLAFASKRSSAGGFGRVIPHPGSGGG